MQRNGLRILMCIELGTQNQLINAIWTFHKLIMKVMKVKTMSSE